MNTKEREEIKTQIRSEYNVRVVSNLQAEIVHFLTENPFSNRYTVTKELNNSSVPKAYDRLKALGVISPKGTVQLNGTEFQTRRVYYPLVDIIREKRMPPTEYTYTHMAAFLATLEDNVLVLETGLTKIKYLEKIRKAALEQHELILKRIYDLQNNLALCSLLAGNLENWKDMNGPIYTGDIK